LPCSSPLLGLRWVGSALLIALAIMKESVESWRILMRNQSKPMKANGEKQIVLGGLKKEEEE
jgi:hypothetical protein